MNTEAIALQNYIVFRDESGSGIFVQGTFVVAAGSVDKAKSTWAVFLVFLDDRRTRISNVFKSRSEADERRDEIISSLQQGITSIDTFSDDLMEANVNL